MTETPEAQPITPVEKIRSALTWYRVLAWMTSTVPAGVLATKTKPPARTMGEACGLRNVG